MGVAADILKVINDIPPSGDVQEPPVFGKDGVSIGERALLDDAGVAFADNSIATNVNIAFSHHSHNM